MTRQTIQTDKAPAAVGTYSQAVKVGNTVYLSGQIALDPQTMQLKDSIEAQISELEKNKEKWNSYKSLILNQK